jgi:hypothetical protein
MTISVTHTTPADASFSATGAAAWNATHSFTGVLDVANGGTGTATPSLVAGTNVTITGTWPNQTINSSGGGGGGGPILESQIVISQNYTLTNNTNGFSVSPVTIAAGYAVTVPTGQVWAIWNT